MRLSSSIRGLRVGALTAVLCFAAFGNTARAADAAAQQGFEADSTACAGVLRMPLRLDFIVPGGLVPGGSALVQARLHADAFVDSIHVDLSATGSVSLAGPTALDAGALSAGDSLDLGIPVQFSAAGHGTITAVVTVAAVEPANTGTFTLDVLLRPAPYRSLAGPDGRLLLEFAAVEADLADALLSPGEADSLDDLLRTDTATTAVDSVVGKTSLPHAAPGNVTISGTIYFKDKNGDPHPLPRAKVEIRDKESSSDRLIKEVETNLAGFFTATVLNDDGFLGGGLDVFLRAFSEGPLARVHSYNEGVHHVDCRVVDNVRDNLEYIFEMTIQQSGFKGACWNVLAAANWAGEYTKSINGGEALPQLDVESPMATIKRPGGVRRDISQYDSNAIYILTGDKWDWDVIMHEFGHYVEDKFDLSANPGGTHQTACLSVEKGSKDKGVKMAWAEGFATFFGCSAQRILNLGTENIPDVGDRWYDDGEDSKIQISLEAQGTHVGEDSEFAVARAFWDLWDTEDDGDESIAIEHTTLWKRVKDVKAKTLSQAWAKLRAEATGAIDLGIAGVAANHLLGPAPVGGVTAKSFVQPELRWTRAVGCGSHRGDRFGIALFRPGTPPTRIANIATMRNLSGTSHQVTDAEALTIFAATGDGVFVWAVEGANTTAPATGLYMGRRAQAEAFLPIVPVVLERFECGADERGVQLTWAAGAGAAPPRFEVARADAQDGPFAAWTEVPAQANGEYAFRDADVLPGSAYWYRLDAVQANGERSTLALRSVVFDPAHAAWSLSAATPRPFRAAASVRLRLPRAAAVTARVYDVAGNVTRELVAASRLAAGTHALVWDGTTSAGRRAAAGVYFLRVEAGGAVRTERLVLLR